ncbi:MAG TPA: hypothetical protein PK639_04315 [Candidatus Woesebacteria bacterium]|nr:hypothetical protein [Candidatus Woesebacteria bacterium]
MIDPIVLLGLEKLTQEQKNKIFPVILADISAFIIDSFFEQLPEENRELMIKQLEEVKDDSVKIVKLLEDSDPEFEKKKMEYIEKYRQEFRLQKFIEYL